MLTTPFLKFFTHFPLQKARKESALSEIPEKLKSKRAFGYFDASSQQKIDPL